MSGLGQVGPGTRPTSQADCLPGYVFTPAFANAQGIMQPANCMWLQEAQAGPRPQQQPVNAPPISSVVMSASAEAREARWRYTSYALGALIVAQFFWWNAKAPQVLKLSRNRRRRRRR